MLRTINVRCKNTGKTHRVPAGFTMEEVYDMLEINLPYECTSVKVNNKTEGLHYTIYNDKDIEFIDITNPSGMRTYTRSLFFVLYKAVCEVYPQARLRIDTPVSNGYYCRLSGLPAGVNGDVVVALRNKMRAIIDANLPYHRITAPTDEAIALFRQHRLEDKAQLLEGSGLLYTTYYTLGGTPDYFYGSLLINTGQIQLFDLVPYYDGLLLRVPDPKNPEELKPMIDQRKMFDVFNEQHRWQEILGISTIGQFNKACSEGGTDELINISEALQEKRISALADRIANQPAIKVILISGPSSSGKTTFCKRLAVQLSACGKRPMTISLDDYFVDRSKTPLDEQGEYDYEHINAMNISLLNKQLDELLKGETVELPKFNFLRGISEKSGIKIRMEEGTLLILEGIHALNPMLTAQISNECKFKIYASALTTILLDDHNYIPTADNRLLRRIIRDFKYRGYSAEETIRRWPSVRSGEEKWIFPYQEEADVMMNTALLFEFAALRNQALPLLEQVPENVPEYSEAYRLRKFLSYLKPISIRNLPPTSLLREFLGGSVFRY